MGTDLHGCKRTLLLATGLLLSGACGSAGQEAPRSAPTGEPGPTVEHRESDGELGGEMVADSTDQGDPVGRVDREIIETRVPAWRTARQDATPDPEASRQLGEVEPGAQVDIYVGTWCGDSRREVPRLWSAFDLAGELPFEVSYVAVDRAKEAPDGLLDGVDLAYVPTIVVSRDGEEVGRIVESAPDGVETALLELLRGERTGVITGRTDL